MLPSLLLLALKEEKGEIEKFLTRLLETAPLPKIALLTLTVFTVLPDKKDLNQFGLNHTAVLWQIAKSEMRWVIPMIHSQIGGMTGSVMKMEKVKAKELVTVPDSSVKNS